MGPDPIEMVKEPILRSHPDVLYSTAPEIEPEDVSLSERVLVKWEIG